MSEKLERSIEELARTDRRFPPGAYMLVFEGLEMALARLPHRRHVAPKELIEGIRDAALDQWGWMARTVLEGWNVRSTSDLGDIVFSLIRRGLLVAGDEDHRAQFDDLLDFRDAFDDTFVERLERQPPRLLTA